MSERYDAAIIGAGVNGLTAAVFLARAGKRVVVLEAGTSIGGMAQAIETDGGFLFPRAVPALHALDPQILRRLRSVRRGLAFVSRDLPLVALSGDGKHLVLSRDVHAAARSIAAHSQSDAAAWPAFRKSLFGLARAMRRQWWDDERPRLNREQRDLLTTLQVTSAVAWLDGQFETDLLKAALAFDALDGNGSLLEPGSALPLVWRAAQEMCGLQGAVALPRRGAMQVARLLADAAGGEGVTIRTGAEVGRILVDADGVAGVALSSGETVEARTVLSSLSRRVTLLELAADAMPLGEGRALARDVSRTGRAAVVLGLNDAIALGGAAVPSNARFVVADRLETMVAGHAAARARNLPDDLAIEAFLTSASDTSLAPPGMHVLACIVRPVPQANAAWETMTARLEAKVLATLDRFAPGLVPKVVEIHSLTPRDHPGDEQTATPTRMLAPWSSRMSTAIPGLILCGADSEPVSALSGRAGRLAAEFGAMR